MNIRKFLPILLLIIIVAIVTASLMYGQMRANNVNPPQSQATPMPTNAQSTQTPSTSSLPTAQASTPGNPSAAPQETSPSTDNPTTSGPLTTSLPSSSAPPPSGTSAPSNPPSGTAAPTTDQVYSNGQYRVLAWNDLGMHCYNPSFQDIGVLPPYNNLWAQVIRIGEEPRIVTSGVKVTYSIVDNTYSVGKTDFWSYEDKLFNVNLQDNIGLTGKSLTGAMDVSGNHFVAEGIPVTEYRDQDAQTKTRYPCQLATVTVTDANTGALLAKTTVTTPVSSELSCNNCHSDTGEANKKYAVAVTGNVDQNILKLHDMLHPENNPKLMDSRPVLCASCHSSNALQATGRTGIPSLSNAIHANHANVPGMTADLAGCYQCHPGPQTRCLRDVMSAKGMDCLDCHGDLTAVSQNTNPWLNEPRCDSASCHPSTVRQTNALFRLSTAMGGIYCEACHGSTHAVAPSREASDAIQVMALQGKNAALSNCSVCHGSNFHEGDNPHVAEDDGLSPNAFLYSVLPFGIILPMVAFVVYRKKLKVRLGSSSLQ